MKENYNRFNMFLESIHSGTKIFKNYKDLTDDENLITILDEIISYFKTHETELTNFLVEKNVDPNDSLSFGREFIVWMDKVKTQMMFCDEDKDDTVNDFMISINTLKGINMGTTKGMEFIYKHAGLDVTVLKKVISDYSYLYNKMSNFILNEYLK